MTLADSASPAALETPPIARALRSFDAAVARVEGALLVGLLGVLVFAGFWQVVQRNLGTAAASWVDTFNRHLVLWIGLLGAMLATREGKHVNIEAVRKFLPARMERWVDAALHGFSAVIAGAFAWASALYLAAEIDDAKILFTVETLRLRVPTWVTETILPVAFGVIALRSLAQGAARAAGIPAAVPPPGPAASPGGGAGA